MDFDSLFVLGDSEALENTYDTGQYGGIDWLPATAAHLESHLGLETPRDGTLLGPADTALTMMDYQVQLNGDSDMLDADFGFEDQATLTDWNNFNASRIQDLDLPAACSLSGLTDQEKNSTVGQYAAHTEPGPQTREPSLAINHYLNGAETSSIKQASPEDWTKHRGLITCLYEKMTLPEVMRHMEQQKGFSAT